METTNATKFVEKLTDDPSLLYRKPEQAKESLHAILQSTFDQYIKGRHGQQKRVKLAIEGFGLDQIWAQIEHHTEHVNTKLIGNLSKLINDEQFLSDIMKEQPTSAEHSQKSDGEEMHEEGEAEMFEEEEDGESELEFMQKNKETIFDKNDSDVDKYMDELEDDEFAQDGLKIPGDVDSDEYDEEEEPEGSYEFEKEEDDAEEEMDQLFAQAREEGELDLVNDMKQAIKTDFVNQDQVGKIEQIEDEMMNPKSWEMIGEAHARDRPINSLLEVHLDFNAATKLPPTITKETTNLIEALIKQRVLDELFDDPVLRQSNKRKKLNDEIEMDFTKSKKGLGDQYADDLTKRLASINPESFLEQELSGPDGALKREIEDLSKDLFQSLEILCNFHYTPRAPKQEQSISSQNVPALFLEDALPITVSKGQTKSAKEIFSVNALSLREKTELSKEDRHKERAQRKRKIKQSLKAKSTYKKEKMREQGIAMAEKFAVRDAERQMEKMNKKLKKGKKDDQPESRRTNTSSKVFANLQQIVKEDYKKKEDRKNAKASGKSYKGGDYAQTTSGASSKKYRL